MRIGAILLASKMGNRHNGKKSIPALNGESVIQAAVDTFVAFGASPMIVVSGRDSADLTHHLGKKHIHHIVNREFSYTSYGYSAQLGLAAAGDADYVFVLPSEAPLLNRDSLAAMTAYMAQHPDCQLLRPEWGDNIGWPVLIKKTAFRHFIGYRGKGGLNGAMRTFGGSQAKIPLDDAVLYLNIKHKEDFQRFMELAREKALNKQLIGRVDLQLERDKPFFNRTLAQLLHQVETSGSLLTACRDLGFSYSHGWQAIKMAEGQLGFALLASSRGGGSSLTPDAKALLVKYDGLFHKLSELCAREFADFFA